MLSFRKLLSSFQNALNGLRTAWQKEQSFRLQVLFALLVIVLMIVFPLHRIERAILVLSIGLVLGLEILNSQIERVLDFLEPNHDPRVKAIKDLSAGAVLAAVTAASIIGIFIFLPYLL